MRVLIVDDERAARQRLALLLEELDVEVAGEAADGVEALRLAAELRPDVVLLDIHMPEVDGFDVAQRLPEPRPLLVFQTAYDEHALRAFDHAAVDYLVKPVSRALLERALRRAAERLATPAARDTALPPELLRALREAAALPPGRAPRLLVRHGAGHRLLPLAEILRFQAEDSLVYAVARDARFLTDYTLRDVETRTTGVFVRTSRGELVNLDHVERLQAHGDASLALDLSDGSRVVVSRRRAADVRRAVAELGQGPARIVKQGDDG